MEISRNEGRRELFERLSAGRRPPQKTWYNTGSSATLANATQYTQYMNISLGIAQHGVSAVRLAHPPIFETTGGRLVVCAIRNSDTALLATDAEEVVLPATMVSQVRSVFSLNVSEAASVFQVSRPTIYQWNSLDSFEMIRSNKDRERIKSLYRLAKAWEAFGQLHGRWQKAVLSNGTSVFDLLCANDIDAKRIQKLHSVLAAEQSRLKQEEHKRAVQTISKLKIAFSKLAENEKVRNKEST